MSAPLPLRRHARRRTQRAPLRMLVTSTVLLDALFLVGALAAWPIYRSTAFVGAVATGLVVAHALTLAALRWRWSGWWLALAAFAAYAVLGLPVAAPSMLTGGLDQAARGAIAVLTAPVTGWKDLLTLDLPLGSYQATLAPVFFLWLAVPVAALSLAWRALRLWVLAPLLGLALTVFGVVFGAPTVSEPLRWGPLTLTGPREMLVGAAAVLTSLGYLVWRSLHDRRRALHAAEAATGVRVSGRTTSARAGRVAISAAMVAIAVTAGAVAAPLAVAGQSRDVLRERVDPRLEIQRQLSPLAEYRTFFGDDRFDRVLFTVATGADRVRLATLSSYDGRLARVIDPTAEGTDPADAFVRVPSSLTAPPGTRPESAEITIVDYDAVWMPTVGALTGVQFRGTGAAGLADGFFYNAVAQMGVQLSDPGLDAGVGYRQQAAVPESVPAVTSLTPARTTSQFAPGTIPESVAEWIAAQDAPAGGEGLALLIDRLRARGYLSHALAIDEASPPQWRAELGGSPFEPSRAGHSTDRIDTLFTALLQRQNEVGGDDDAALVAAVGDDEQFAVAAAMIADQLGFTTRIVLGARLTGDELPVCDNGCRGGDIAAWIEVQDASGMWVPIDVTPQHEDALAPDDLTTRDPEVPTEVHEEVAEQVLPGDTDPADGGERSDDPAESSTDWGPLWAALRVGGLSLLGLLVITGPFLLILLAKALRRRSRRSAADAVDRVTGGWDEYVDAAIDSGLAAPRTHTRREVAAAHAGGDGTSRATLLADWADRSVFDATPPTPRDSERFWEIVDDERMRLLAARGWWARLRARLSLRSLLRRGERAKGRG